MSTATPISVEDVSEFYIQSKTISVRNITLRKDGRCETYGFLDDDFRAIASGDALARYGQGNRDALGGSKSYEGEYCEDRPHGYGLRARRVCCEYECG